MLASLSWQEETFAITVLFVSVFVLITLAGVLIWGIAKFWQIGKDLLHRFERSFRQ